MLARAASSRITLPLICLAAFLLRAVCGLFGPDHFWAYSAYFHVADTLARGGGYCWEPGRLCAFFPPVYPTVVAAAILAGHVKIGVILLGSLAGAGTVWMTARIGALLFSPIVGVVAAAYAAIYPYFVWHDGVLQENAVLAFAVAICVWLLLRAGRSSSRALWFVAGLALALTVLTKANLALFVPLALFWLGRRRWLYATLGVMVLMGPWVVRTWRITGAPILYSNGGFSLWTANHRLTFDYFPEQSIDAAQEPEWLDVPVRDRHAFYEIHDPQFIQETAWFWKRGMAFIEEHPWLTAGRAIRKVWIAFSPVFSPRHGVAFEAVYLVSYLPLFALAPVGIWRSRDRWRQAGCIYLLIASFAVGCAVFWGHTSHRMYIEPYLMIFAVAGAGPKPGVQSCEAPPHLYSRLMRVIWIGLIACALFAQKPHTTWSDFGGGPDHSQYSALNQINRSNVSQLKIAWTYPIGDGNPYLFSPVVADGVMYVMGKNNSIVALDAASGKEIWSHANARGPITTRGINYWQSSDGKERRLLYANANFLIELDARTGFPVPAFGNDGKLDLREGLGREVTPRLNVQSMTPGQVFENLVIVGSSTNQEYDSAPGDIRAYDVRNGKLVWTFHTIPHEGEFGYDTWPRDAWKTVGGANAWSEMSIDTKRGILYVPTASPKYNFYGADRKGQNLFGDCLLALDVHTGKRLWHYQMVHHDIWDYDNANAPKLLTVRHNGQMVDVVAEAGKTGFLYVFNRVTGEPLWPIEERPVPKSDMPGEETWPTQPFPTAPPPFARQSFTADDLNPYIADDAEKTQIRAEILAARNEGLFTPPGLKNTIEMPGNNGGSNFSGSAIDPEHGTMFVVSKDFPAMLKLTLSGPDTGDPTTMRYKSPFGFMVTNNGLTAIKPPWTTFTAYDLNTGKIKWQIPLGEVPELAAKGITDTGAHFPKVGPVVTAGGLIFTGTRDRYIRALDEDTGKELWKTEVDAGVEGMPAVYEINGREYVVYCAAARSTTHTHAVPGHPAATDPVPGAYVAFALPTAK